MMVPIINAKYSIEQQNIFLKLSRLEPCYFDYNWSHLIGKHPSILNIHVPINFHFPYCKFKMLATHVVNWNVNMSFNDVGLDLRLLRDWHTCHLF